MKKAAILLIALVLLAVGSNSASAQKGNYRLSIPLSVVIPAGEISDYATTGLGIGFELGYWITNGWLIDGQFSYHRFSEKELESGQRVQGTLYPIEVGVTYHFMNDTKYRPYLAARAGYFSFSGDFGGSSTRRTNRETPSPSDSHTCQGMIIRR